jgi:hypothetical protein
MHRKGKRDSKGICLAFCRECGRISRDSLPLGIRQETVQIMVSGIATQSGHS